MQALVSVGMNNNPTQAEAASHELVPIDRSVLNINQELAAVPPHFLRSRSSGRRGRNGDVLVYHAMIALLLRLWWRDYDLQAQRRLELFLAVYDMEAGGQAHGVGARRTGGGAAAPVHEPSVNSLLPLPSPIKLNHQPTHTHTLKYHWKDKHTCLIRPHLTRTKC